MSNVYRVGVVKTDIGDLAPIYTESLGVESKDCYFSNDPYGFAMELSGFKGVKFTRVVDTEQEVDGVDATVTLERLIKLISTQAVGECQGIIAVEGGLLLIKDATFFEGILKVKGQPDCECPKVTTSDVDSYSDVSESLAEALELGF